MIPSSKPEYVVATRLGEATGDEILITNYGREWVKGFDNRTGMTNGNLIGGKLIVPNNR
jgi:hypothetical protein